MLKGLLCLVIASVPAVATAQHANWSGPYQPCLNRQELLKTGHMNLGVRIDTVNPVSAGALRRALRFWSAILDMSFHEEASQACALALVDATPGLLHQHNDVARAQFTAWENFQGWIAFDPRISHYMSADEIYATAVHELGHVFGLMHSRNAGSIMYYIDASTTAVLDDEDMQAIAARHALRPIEDRGPLLVSP